MKAFRFRLDSILGLRRHEEDEIKNELAGVNRRFERERRDRPATGCRERGDFAEV